MKCDSCKVRFKCLTTNTGRAPKLLKGVNFEIANCCYRCRWSEFKNEGKARLGEMSSYAKIGSCRKHNTLIHQFSVCGDFSAKAPNNNMDVMIKESMELVQIRATGSRLPSYCILDDEEV